MAGKPKSAAEPSEPEAPMTQRAYTLRLRRAAGKCQTCKQDACTCWRDALWATHEAVNKGAKVFGDWLLTLRGGLSHELVDQKVFEGKGANKKERGPTDNERRDRRILLALSWLSVESAPRDDHDPRKPFLIGCGKEPAGRKQALREALRAVLQQRGVPADDIGDPNVEPEHQPDTWLGQCGSSLAARIRDDAVWVNRSEMFDKATCGWKVQDARKDAHTLLSFILSANKDDFLTLPTPKKPRETTQQTDEGDEQEERQKEVKASSRGAGQRTRHPFSHLLGEGKPFGKPQRNLILQAQWHNYIKPRLEEIGIPVLDARTSNKAKRKDAAPAHTELQREMFSKAASRIAQIVTKQRQQEADRLARKDAGAELRKMEADPSYRDALAGLRTYCDEYRVSSGATGEFMIRPRQITGWDRVVKRWAAIEEADPDAAREARIHAVKETQEADEEKKFGDPNLFFRLADDRYTSVWRMNGKADPTILERFVRGMKAGSDPGRFKVAAFRHPDPYFNPIFCQFGVSRPAIQFRRLKSFSDSRAGDDPRAVGMLLWHPAVNSAELTLMYGVSQRMDREIGSACDQVHQDAATVQSVSRRGRLGMAAAGLPSADSPARVGGVFDLKRVKSRATADDEEGNGDEGNDNGKLKEPKWNGTLSTNRRDLAVIGKLVAGGDVQKAQRRREQLRWTLTVSMEMECRGPFMDYAGRHEITPNQKGEYYPNADRNKADKREGHAKLMLARLPGLRVLSVDLGHRFAAACAVWETLSRAELEKEIAGRSVTDGGIDEHNLYLHTRHTDRTGKERTTIYRRVGGDRLPDGSDHPAPWARLDRQFLIKLQGEESPARKASPDEIETIRQMESDLGYVRETHNPLPTEIDELLREAVRLVRLGLRRHGDAARIAYAFHPESARLTPGGGVEAHTPDTRRQAILDALIRWHGMATSERWNDPRAMEAWRVHIQPALATDLPALTPDADRWERKRFRTTLEAALTPAATALARDGAAALYALWSERWEAEDAAWRARLRQLRRMVLPRGLRPVDSDTDAQAAARKARRGAARHAGGLSLTRVATVRELYQVQKAYAMRPEPDNPRKNIPESNDDRFAEFGRSILEAVERLREQRVKQIASRIVEAALGVGIERDRVWDDEKKRWRYAKRPRGLLYHEDREGNTHGDPRFKTCHAVVIENLRNYRPDELQTRRENRALMNWSAGKVRKYLEESCQLHGLHLREVTPNYTSRQCSRTGLPGLRCEDVPIDEFLTAPWWNKAVNAAAKRLQEDGNDSLDRLLVALREKWSTASDDDKCKQRTLLLPRPGGDLFVAAPPNGAATAKSQRRRVLQADLNAAANIGLRALLDPDFPGRWWYVPCIEDKVAGTAVPRADKVKGSACFGPDPSKPDQFGSLLKPSDGDSSDGQARSAHRQGTRSSKSDGKETTNYWSDPSAAALRNAASGGFWLPTPPYWRWVRKRVVAVLWQANGLSAPPADLVRDGQP